MVVTMSEKPFDPVAIQRALDTFTRNMLAFAEATAEAASKILNRFSAARRLDAQVALAHARSAHGGNGYLVGDQWICGSCMGWIHEDCPGLGCDCRARAHR